MEEITNFLNFLNNKGLSEHTYNNYKKDLFSFSSFFSNKKIMHLQVNDIREYIRNLYDKEYKSSTISRHISTLKSFYSFLQSQGFITNNPMDLISNPKKEKLLPNYLNYDDLERLLSTPDIGQKNGLRDALILEMLYSTGIRVSELVNIKLKDIKLKENKIIVFGKGKKERIVFFGSKLENMLNKYLQNHQNEYLFINTKEEKLNDRTVRKIVSDNARKANINVTVTPHTLRHTYATHMLNAGADLKCVGDLLGHENLSTTQIYTHVSNERLRSVYLKAHPRAKSTWKNN